MIFKSSETHMRLFLIVALIAFSGCTHVKNSVFKTELALERYRSGLHLKLTAIDKHKIAYLEGGEGETVFLLHGFTSNKDSWVRFAKQLTKFCQIIAIDLPAHGDSTFCPDCQYDIPSQARYVKQIVDQLNFYRVHLIGNSMGGAISILFSHFYPDRVKTLALFDAAGVMSPMPSELIRLLEKGINPFIIHNKEEFRRFVDMAMETPPFFPWPLKSVMYQQYLSRNDIHQKVFNDMQHHFWQTQSILHEIKAPVLILWGKDDQIIDVSCVPIFERKIPNSTTVILENTGHCPMLERPKVTASHYLEFMKNHQEQYP